MMVALPRSRSARSSQARILAGGSFLVAVGVLALFGEQILLAENKSTKGLVAQLEAARPGIERLYDSCSIAGTIEYPKNDKSLSFPESFHYFAKGKKRRLDLAYSSPVPAAAAAAAARKPDAGSGGSTKSFKDRSLVANPDKSFEVLRAQPQSPYIVSAVEEDHNSMLTKIRRINCSPAFSPHAIFGHDIIVFLASSPTFTITKESTIRDGSRELLRVDCTANVEASKGPLSGYFVFDKGANMALVEHCWGYPKKLYLTKIKYAGAKKEMLCVSLVETFMQLNGTEDFQLVSRFTITEISDQPPSDDKFTLAAFGIGTGAGKSGVKWYFWMIVGGIAILLALYLARRMRWFDRAQSFLGR